MTKEVDGIVKEQGDLKIYVYKVIRNKIINCVYPPGSVIYEQMITDELEVSRTPVREALNRIEQEGFIRIMPKKGIFVKEISVADVGEIFQIREEFEPIVVRLAAPYLNRERLLEFREKYENDKEISARRGDDMPYDTLFHLYIVENCNNKFIEEFMAKIFDRNAQIFTWSKQHERHLYDSNQDHIEIIDNILAGRYDEAAAANKRHVIHVRDALINYLLKNQRR